MASDGAAARVSREMTLDEWGEMDEDEPGELVDGHLEEEEMPTILHEAVVSWLLRILSAWVVPRGGWVFGSELKLAVAPRRGRKPDLSMYLPGARVSSRTSSLARTPPTIVVEVISPRPRDGRRDRIDKVPDYARFGVRYYWLVDPQVRTLEIFRLARDGRRVVAVSLSAGTFAAPGCSGLTLDLDALWREADRLPATEAPRRRTVKKRR